MAALFPFVPREWWASVVLVAGLSDLADGMIARRLGVASAAGGQFDAITDKVFAVCVLATFLYEGVMQPWHAIMLLSRDIVVIALAIYVASQRHWAGFSQMPARPLGKLTTAMLFVFFLSAVTLPSDHAVAEILFVVAVLLAFTAAVDYVIQLVKAQRKVNAARQS